MNNKDKSDKGSRPAKPADVPPPPAAEDESPPTMEKPDPTRYGDWEKNGRCVDF